jgi:hypothetical protein
MFKPILFNQVTLKIISCGPPIVSPNQILILHLKYVIHVSYRRPCQRIHLLLLYLLLPIDICELPLHLIHKPDPVGLIQLTHYEPCTRPVKLELILDLKELGPQRPVLLVEVAEPQAVTLRVTLLLEALLLVAEADSTSVLIQTLGVLELCCHLLPLIFQVGYLVSVGLGLVVEEGHVAVEFGRVFMS